MEHTYIALIRGVNVGGHSKLNMQELRTICTNLGWHSVTTYINSGNVVFRIATTDTKILGTGLSDAIRNATGLNVAVLVTSLPDLEAIFAYNPFTDVDAALSKESYIMLLDNEPSPDAISSLSPTMFEPDRFVIHDRAIYLLYPYGSARSKLTQAFFERKLHTIATSRNRRTIAKLIEIAKI